MLQEMVRRAEGMPVVGRMASRLTPAEPTWKQRLRRAMPYVATGGAGLAVGYFFDVDRGRGRRARTKDRIAGLGRRGARKARRTARYAASEARGLRQRMEHRSPEPVWLDDATLAHKIESEVLGDPAIDKGRLNVNAENGVVVVRGTMDTPEDIQRLERQVRGVSGVADVRMLVHPKNQGAHWKDPARRASARAADQVGSQGRSL